MGDVVAVAGRCAHGTFNGVKWLDAVASGGILGSNFVLHNRRAKRLYVRGMITLPANLRLSCFVLFGDSEFMVGLSDSRWLRLPLAAFPQVQAMTEDEKLDYRMDADRSAIQWPQHGIALSLLDLCSKAVSIESGDEGPK